MLENAIPIQLNFQIRTVKREQIEIKDWDEINSLGIGVPSPGSASS